VAVFALFTKRTAPEPAPAVAATAAVDGAAIVRALAPQASTLGRASAEVRGVLDDTHKVAQTQVQAAQALAMQLQQVVQSQSGIAVEADSGLQAVSRVSDAVQAVGAEVDGIVQTLREVSQAAGQITQVALQTRLVAFNASVEAKRAGVAGAGFGVVADAVKALAGQVEASSKEIMGTVGRLDARITALARDIRLDPGSGSGQQPGAVQRALDDVSQGVQRIHAASAHSRAVCAGLNEQMGGIEADMQRTAQAMGAALDRSEAFLGIAEALIESVANSGVETEDTRYIAAARQAAASITGLLDEALRSGAIQLAELFDENYQPLAGTNPAQHSSRFMALAEKLFPPVQESMLTLSDKVVYCITADRNGYIACHNRKYNHPQRPGDLVWNTANSRYRRIFNDRTGLASARNRRPFLLQTYRRDMGGGQFVVMKEAAAPITVAGRHWGGIRLAFKF
jgi:methyl-accepting chemotaxis protein